ncbi:splicing factor C9orf78-like [Paramacrobiotus metropolitanus]|uniref:splicing factor C9orf78-like n=1 Tax=Paramacrobiotus metropolitanus TaxID=2943436 RepID=UPI00244648CA|nr:splicing factor C9orf78-like [Paramacrobiotus metropolitanus]
MSDASTDADAAVFAVRKRRPNAAAKRKVTSEEAEADLEEASVTANVLEVLEQQKSRKRPHGINIEDLAGTGAERLDNQSTTEVELAKLKMQTGGMVSLKTARAMASLPNLESGGQHIDIGTEFSAETQRRDEDYDMMTFIEEEIMKRKIRTGDHEEEKTSSSSRKILRPEDALLVVAERYQTDTKHRSEEMLSHQMLSGIPEVDLGIEAKIRNIEATEEAKRRLMQKYREGSPGDTRSSKVQKESTAMSYVQHMRYNLDNYVDQREAKPDQVKAPSGNKPLPEPVKQPSLPSAEALTGSAKPSDGQCFDRFKKNFMEKLEKDKKSKRDK